MSETTDRELALAAAAGNRAAFAALAGRHYDRVYRLAWRWVGSRDTAEDVVQEVMVKLAHAIGGFRGDSEFTTWLYRIAYTSAVDQMRARQRTVTLAPSQMMALTESGGHDGNPDATPLDDIEGQQLWQAVRTLPDQQRDAVLLVYGEDLTHAEAASVLGCRESTVSWHLHEARKRLRIKLEAAG